jgi:hypothetical protein
MTLRSGTVSCSTRCWVSRRDPCVGGGLAADCAPPRSHGRVLHQSHRGAVVPRCPGGQDHLPEPGVSNVPRSVTSSFDSGHPSSSASMDVFADPPDRLSRGHSQRLHPFPQAAHGKYRPCAPSCAARLSTSLTHLRSPRGSTRDSTVGHTSSQASVTLETGMSGVGVVRLPILPAADAPVQVLPLIVIVRIRPNTVQVTLTSSPVHSMHQHWPVPRSTGCFSADGRLQFRKTRATPHCHSVKRRGEIEILG